MKKVILIAIVLPMIILAACSKNEGCNDPSAFNYSIEVDFDDGSCSYSNLVFYGDSANYPATAIDHVEITISGTSIGTFVGTSYGISDCANPGDESADFAMPSSTDVQWTSHIYLTNGSSSTKTGTASSDLGQQCILINAL